MPYIEASPEHGARTKRIRSSRRVMRSRMRFLMLAVAAVALGMATSRAFAAEVAFPLALKPGHYRLAAWTVISTSQSIAPSNTIILSTDLVRLSTSKSL